VKLTHILSNVRNFIVLADRCRIEKEPLLDQDLFDWAAEFAQASWFLRRKLRRSNAANATQPQHGNWEFTEYCSLLAYAHALFDAGDFIANAAISARLLWTLPDKILEHPYFADIDQKLYNVFTQKGYEAPQRFEGKKKDSQHQEVLPGRNKISKRLEAKLSSDPRWNLIRSLYQSYPNEVQDEPLTLWDYLAWAEDHSAVIAHPDVGRAALSLCLDYGELRRAASFLDKIQPTTRDILVFASSMRRASQLLPLLLSVKTFDNWQTVLVNAFSKLPKSEIARLSVSQHFLVHEMLTGRCATIIRGAPRSFQQFYREKFDDEVSEPPLREALQEKISPLVQSVGTVTPGSLSTFLPTGRFSELDKPTCVSLASLGADRFSLIVRNPNNEWHTAIFSIPGFASALQRTMEWGEVWHTEDGVPWENEAITLIQRIGEFLRLGQRTNWLMLSVSSDFGAMPWQDLVFRHLHDNTVVTVIPNFTWASMEFHKPTHHSKSIHRLGMNPEYAETATIIRQRINAIDGASYVLGHGTWEEHKFTSVEAGNGPLLPEDWRSYATRRVCVVHSCWGGRSEDHLLGDLGGLPYNGFVLGCRFFCAPVSEVWSKTATVLHRHLTNEFASSELGLRYLNAIREDPAAALYTIYGFANEPAKLNAPNRFLASQRFQNGRTAGRTPQRKE
jgi:hypothetical protein